MSNTLFRSFAIIGCALSTLGLAPPNVSPSVLKWLNSHEPKASERETEIKRDQFLTKKINGDHKNSLENNKLPHLPSLSAPRMEPLSLNIESIKTHTNNEQTSQQKARENNIEAQNKTAHHDKWNERLKSMWPNQKDLWGMRHLTTKEDLARMKSGKSNTLINRFGEISRTSPSLLIERQKTITPLLTTHPATINDCASSKDLSVLLSPACVREMETFHSRGPQSYSSEENLPEQIIPNRTTMSERQDYEGHLAPYPVICHIAFFPTSGESVIHDVRISSTKDCMAEADIISRGRTGREAVTIDDENTKTHFDVACVRSSPFTIACHAR